MTESWARQVHGDRDVRGLQVVDKGKEGVGETENSARVFTSAPRHKRFIFEGIVGTMNDAVPVKDSQQGFLVF